MDPPQSSEAAEHKAAIKKHCETNMQLADELLRLLDTGDWPRLSLEEPVLMKELDSTSVKVKLYCEKISNDSDDYITTAESTISFLTRIQTHLERSVEVTKGHGVFATPYENMAELLGAQVKLWYEMRHHVADRLQAARLQLQMDQETEQ
ncbi:hypothetical protein BJX99DRAFT_254090 [Aspergillus californicus]